MNKSYKSIIWDWNGTLLDDVTFCLDIVNAFLVTQEIEALKKEEYLNVFGFPISDYYKKIGVDFSKVSYEEITRFFIDKYDAGVRNCSLHSNVQNMLSLFFSGDLDQYILTAAHKNSVLSLLEHFGIFSFFKHIEGLDHYRGDSKLNRGKMLVKKNKIYPNETILIGDTNHDFEVANHLGIDCILIANGHQSREKLKYEVGESCIIVNNLSDIIEFVFDVEK